MSHRIDLREFCAWQFHGPFLHDFAGQQPAGRRDAGALGTSNAP